MRTWNGCIVDDIHQTFPIQIRSRQFDVAQFRQGWKPIGVYRKLVSYLFGG